MKNSYVISKENFFDTLEKFGRKNGINLVKISRKDTIGKSLKRIVFPPVEILFHFKENLGIEVEPPKENEKILVFGARSCEVEALKLVKRIAEDGFMDAYILKRLSNLDVIALECDSVVDSRCSCLIFGFGPEIKDNDVVSVIGTSIKNEKFLLRVNDNGKKLIKELISLGLNIQKAGKEDLELRENIITKVKNDIKRNFGRDHTLDANFLNGKENRVKDITKTLAKACLSCRICTFLCPTCHCFDVEDFFNELESFGYRLRYWDSCMNPEFSKTSFMNFRESVESRLLHRTFHKLKYIPERYNTLGCVGCGNCSRYCPIGIGIPEIVKLIYQT